MKKYLFIALALLTMGSQIQVCAQKKEKKEKGEKKELKWDWDGTLSKNDEIDKYLLTIDTLYNKVQAYSSDFGSFNLQHKVFADKNGKFYRLVWMADESGQVSTRGRVNWQFAQAYVEGTLIVLDMTNAGLMSANAALTLPQLGLGALKFGKYVKGGPAVISKGINTIKEIRGKCLANSREWKGVKDGSVKDPRSIAYDGFTDDIVKKLNKCYYIKEIQEDDAEYAEEIAVLRNMTQEERDVATNATFKDIEAATVLPEDKDKDVSDDDFEKEMQNMKDEDA